MSLRIDLNADLGEGAEHDDELLALISSANISCGVHAGDAGTMKAAMREARKRGVRIGAHPSFADRENFGRREMTLDPAKVYELVLEQVGSFHAAAHSLGIAPQHVKPHGALYNMAARSAELADAISRALAAVDRTLILFAPGASALEDAAQSNELTFVREVFADRNYAADGSLVRRDRAEALLHDPAEAAERVLRMLREGRVRAIDGNDITVQAETICIHGDTPDAVEFARALHACLARAGVAIAPPRDAAADLL